MADEFGDGVKKGGAKKSVAKSRTAKKATSAKKAGAAKKAAGTKKAARAGKKATSSPRTANAGHADVAERAYYIHEREGGDAVDNWLRAERELNED